jgi:hypothetical protein
MKNIARTHRTLKTKHAWKNVWPGQHVGIIVVERTTAVTSYKGWTNTSTSAVYRHNREQDECARNKKITEFLQIVHLVKIYVLLW